MEVGGPVPPIADVIQAVPLNFLQGNAGIWTKEPGIIGSSWQLRAIDAGLQHPARVSTPVTPFVDVTDSGISIVWWTYWNTLATSSGSGIRYNFRIAGVDHIIQVYQWPANLIALFDFGNIITEASLPMNAWQFMALRYENATGDIRLDVNQALHYTANVGALPLGPYANSVLQLEADVNGVGGLNMRFDEVAFFQELITDDQLDMLYNSGAGRTWP